MRANVLTIVALGAALATAGCGGADNPTGTLTTTFQAQGASQINGPEGVVVLTSATLIIEKVDISGNELTGVAPFLRGSDTVVSTSGGLVANLLDPQEITIGADTGAVTGSYSGASVSLAPQPANSSAPAGNTVFLEGTASDGTTNYPFQVVWEGTASNFYNQTLLPTITLQENGAATVKILLDVPTIFSQFLGIATATPGDDGVIEISPTSNTDLFAGVAQGLGNAWCILPPGGNCD